MVENATIGGSKPTQIEEPPEIATPITTAVGDAASPAAEPISDEVLEADFEVAESKETRQLTQVREELGITEAVDPLKAILDAPIGPVTGEWECKRLNTKFAIRALNSREYNQIQDRATRWTRNKRTGRNERDLDPMAMSLLVCASGTTNPNFNNPQIKKKYGLNDRQPHEIVSVILLPGEIDKLAEQILNLSGYEEDLEDLGKD